MNNHIIYLVPLIGAIIGWVTNWMAVKMLFHPRNEIRIWFFSIQGVFPKRQKKLAQKLGELVSTELFSIEDVKIKLKEKSASSEVLGVLEVHIDKFLKEKLPQAIPMIAMFLNDNILVMVKTALVKELKEVMGVIIDNLGDQLHEVVDVHEIVREKVESFSCEKLEDILFVIMKKEFKFIEFVGGVLGFLIGLVQMLIITNI